MRGLIGLVSLCVLAGTAGPASAQGSLERGRYLVETVGACGNCHTPKGPDGDEPGKHLAGGFQLDEDFGTWITPNITPDPETGIGRWTDAEVILAIREGKRPDGQTLGPPMPFDLLSPPGRQRREGDGRLPPLGPVHPERGAAKPVQDPAPSLLRPAGGRGPRPAAAGPGQVRRVPGRSGGALRGVPHPLPAGGSTRCDSGGRRRAPVPRPAGRELRGEPDARRRDRPRDLEGRRNHRVHLRRAPGRRPGCSRRCRPSTMLRGIAEGDLRAIIAYLRSLPPMRNKVSAPEPPKKP